MDREEIFENAALGELNQMALPGSPPCERVLGGKMNVIRASSMALQNGHITRLIVAHLVLQYCLEKNVERDSKEVKAFKSGLVKYIDFLASCVKEAEAGNRQQFSEESSPNT